MEWLKSETLTTLNADRDVDQQELPGGNTEWYRCFGRESSSFLFCFMVLNILIILPYNPAIILGIYTNELNIFAHTHTHKVTLHVNVYNGFLLIIDKNMKEPRGPSVVV